MGFRRFEVCAATNEQNAEKQLLRIRFYVVERGPFPTSQTHTPS